MLKRHHIGMLCASLVAVASWSTNAQADSHKKSEAHQSDHSHAEETKLPKEGVCVLIPTEGSTVKGFITFTQEHGYVHIVGKVSGLTPGKHGFHIHEFGDLRAADGTSAGGHYNPDGHKHGGLDDKEHHAGDLGNIEADDQGIALVDIKGTGLKLHFLLGRGLVVHAKEDDLKSQPTGDAGGRVAVGVIGYAQLKK